MRNRKGNKKEKDSDSDESGILKDEKVDGLRACVVVMGDLGHSPRMVNHCLSLSKDGRFDHIDFVGYEGSTPPKTILDDPQIQVHYLTSRIVNFMKKLPRLCYLCYLMSRIIMEILTLLWTLLITIERPDVIIMQNPPNMPLLFVCLVVRFVRGSKLVLDWHNYGFTIMRVNNNRRILVWLAERYEKFFGPYADAHICVSKGMR